MLSTWFYATGVTAGLLGGGSDGADTLMADGDGDDAMMMTRTIPGEGGHYYHYYYYYYYYYHSYSYYSSF